MEYKKPVVELIKARKSSRTYKEIDIESETIQKLNDFIAKINKESKISARFVFTRNEDAESAAAKKLGTYGVIKGANSFIVGVLDKGEKNALEFGRLFEKIILFATDLGLATCWLGGTFKKGDFAKNLSLAENEFIPIVSPVGYEKDKLRVVESAMRTVIGADKRKPWSELFFEENGSTPLNEISAAPYAVPLEMVRLAPSASNKQPWRIIKDNKTLHFYVCRTKGYGVTGYDMQKNDIGIAKCHFELTANELGLKGNWQGMKNMPIPTGFEYVCSWVEEM